jgi:hypothetical protein
MFFLVFLPVPGVAGVFVEVGGTINAAHVSSGGLSASTGGVNRFRTGWDRRRRTGDNLSDEREFRRALVPGSW